MNRIRNIRLIAATAFITFLVTGFSTPVFADDAATTALLCSGSWEVSGIAEGMRVSGPQMTKQKVLVPWSRVRVFQKDGTFTTQNAPIESGTWAISGGTINLTFTDKHVDSISLPLDSKGTPGTDADGKPTNVTQLPPDPAPASPEIKQKAADLISAYNADLALVSGTEGAGSGFIAVVEKANYLVTETHIVAGINNASFKTLDNQVIRGGAASIAIGGDIFCMAVPAASKPLEIMTDVDKNAAVGDDVAVLTNVGGEGVAHALTGQILGIEPGRIEVNVPFVPGYTGSPIIHLKTGKVIGVAESTTTSFDAVNHVKYVRPIVRRYACRIDSIKSWQNVDWREFYSEAAAMDKIETLTGDLYLFFATLDQNKGVIAPQNYASPAVMKCFDQWSQTGGRVNSSAEDRKKADETLLLGLKEASQMDVTAAQRRMTYDYFQRKLADQSKARDELSKELKRLIDRLND